MFLTPMDKIERREELLSGDARSTDVRIKEIGRVFSLMAAMHQHGSRIKMEGLTKCMAVLDVWKCWRGNG